MTAEFRRFTGTEDGAEVGAEAEALAEFLGGGPWPFHAGGEVRREAVLRRVAEGYYDGPESQTFWIVEGGEALGLIRLLDLADETPLFDLRIAEPHRGRGLGRSALEWLTRYLFTEFPAVRRVEGTTRQDNAAMRQTFLRCGYAKEAHYRAGWPDAAGRWHDSVGYAILREDWVSGRATPVPWEA